MPKTTSSITVRDAHRREYRRMRNRVTALSIMAWIVLTIWLGGSYGSTAVIAMSFTLAAVLLITRMMLWVRYRREMRADLAAQQAPE